MRTTFAAAALLIMLGSLPSQTFSVYAQEPTTITLAQSNGPPDANVTVPVYLKAAQGVRVGGMKLTVTFPARLLTFVDAELSGLSTGAGVELTTAVKAGNTPGISAVDMTLSTTTEGGASEPLADGPVVYIIFKIVQAAEPGTLIAITPDVTVHTVDDPPKTVDRIAAPEGQIVVSKAAVISCFFYMH